MSDEQNEVVKGVVELAKDVAGDLIRPTSKSIGDNLGLFVDGVMGWLGYWGERQKVKRSVYLKDYKKRIQSKVNAIPAKRLVEPKMRIIGPAVEASKYYIEEEDCREMFAKLIASSCDSETADLVHPSFPGIIQQLSPEDARFLQIFTYNATYPAFTINEEHSDGKITPYPHVMIDFKNNPIKFDVRQELNISKSIESLSRFEIVKLNREVIELNYDYNQFKQHWYYVAIQKAIEEGSQILMTKYRIELSLFGQDFLKCCIPSPN